VLALSAAAGLVLHRRRSADRAPEAGEDARAVAA
jgi:hypothetical protein